MYAVFCMLWLIVGMRDYVVLVCFLDTLKLEKIISYLTVFKVKPQ